MRHGSLLAGGALALALAACSAQGDETATTAAAEETGDVALAEESTAAVEDTATDEADTSADATEETAETEAVEEKAEEAKETAKAEKKEPEVAAAVAAAPAAEIVKAAATSGPPAGWTRCATCHTVDKGGADKLGPNLHGVYNSAAAQGSFPYTDALKGAGLKWDEATLHKWLENPRKMVPGNRMSFPGIKDAAKRQEIIDYLKKQA